MQRVLLLLPTTTYKATEFLDAARRVGVEVVVAADRRQALADEAGGTTLQVEFADPATDRTVVAAHEERPFAAVLGVDDETTVAAARLAGRLGLPHDDPEAVGIATHKARFRAAQHAAGLAAPGYRLLDRDLDPARAGADQEFPCVLKPTTLSGSRGVIRANDEQDFRAAFRRISALLRDLGRGDREILVEEYLDGEELAIEGLLEAGRFIPLACFDKPDPLVGPCFAETLYVSPARLRAPVRDAAIAAVADSLRAIGLQRGPVHAEVRLPTTGPPVVLEVAPRTIGGRCGRALRFGPRASLAEVVLRHALGEPAPQPSSDPVGVLMLPVPRTGTLMAVTGVEDALATPGVTGVDITIGAGQRVAALPEGDRYLGFVYADGATADDVERSLRSAWSRLVVEIEPEPPQPLAEL